MMEPRKWKEYYHLPEIEEIRNKIKDTYSNKLQFIEESHQYFLDGVEFKAVSNVVEGWSSIDEEAMLERCAMKALKYPDYKYFGMTKEEIAAQWKKAGDDACTFGTSVHAFGEGCFYWFTGQDELIPTEVKDKFDDNGPKPTNKHEEAVVKFWNDLPENIVPVLAETKVFNVKGTPYAGTFDILFYYYDETGKNSGLLIMDYKTNGSLVSDYAKNTRQMMLEPFNDLIEQALSHYYLQFCLYQIPLQNLGYKVLGRRLIWLKPDGEYEKYKTPDLSERICNALKIND